MLTRHFYAFYASTCLKTAGLNLASPNHHFFDGSVIVHYDQWNVCSEVSFAANKVDNFNDFTLRFNRQFIAGRF